MKHPRSGRSLAQDGSASEGSTTLTKEAGVSAGPGEGVDDAEVVEAQPEDFSAEIEDFNGDLETRDSTSEDSGFDEDASESPSDSSNEALPARLSPDETNSVLPADPLQRYLAEIRRHRLLDVDEEHELAVRWHEEGDRDAAAQLVTANLRLVVMLARRYQKAFKNLLDLIQEGNVGLLEAVKKFDPYRGVRFPSYAVYWIRAYIIRYVMNNWRLVKLGTTQAQRKLFFNLQKEKDKLEREGYSPDPLLIADRLSVKQSEVVEMEQRLSGRDVSVDTPVGEEGDASMLDFLSDGMAEPEETVGEGELRALVQEHMHRFGEELADKERVIFEQRMMSEEPKTLQELGETFGVSRERIRQIEERIKRRLRAYLVEQMPDIADVDLSTSPSERGS